MARPAVGPAAASCLPTSLLVPLMKLAQSFVLADPGAPDCPIVYASARFLALTGHPREAVLGRNCRFLQVLVRPQLGFRPEVLWYISPPGGGFIP